MVLPQLSRWSARMLQVRLLLPVTLRAWAFLLLPLTYVIQNPTLADYEDIASGAKAYHAVALGLFLLAASRAPQRAVLAAVGYLAVLIVSTAMSLRVDARLGNALGFLMVFVGASGASMSDRLWARRGAAAAAAVIVLEMVLQLPLILSTAADNTEGRPLYPTLLAGGINIEVSTLTILLGWVLSRQMAVVGVSAAIIFLLTQTRSVFAVLPAAWMARLRVVRRPGDPVPKRGRRPWWLYLLVLGGLAVLGTSNIVDVEMITTRFTNSLGDEPGSQGRMLLYLVAFGASDCYAFGCGLGAAAEMISSSNVADFFEDNFHNVFLQQLVEVGVAGVLVYAALFWGALSGARHRLRDLGLGVAISTTLLMSVLQFNGFEFLTAFLLGLGFSGESDTNLRRSGRTRR